MGCLKLTYHEKEDLNFFHGLWKKSDGSEKSYKYYPFGLQASTSWTREESKNDYLYNAGTELNSTTGIYETMFRGYDAALGRFMQVDPLAHMVSSMSPYQYANNNPALWNDPTGLLPVSVEELWDFIDKALSNNGGSWSSDASSPYYFSQSEAAAINASFTGGDGSGSSITNNGDGTGSGIMWMTGANQFTMVVAQGAIAVNGAIENGTQIATSVDLPSGLYQGNQGENSPLGVGDLEGFLPYAGYAGYAGDAAEYARHEMIAARTGRDILSNVGRSGDIKTIYWLGQGSKWLGHAGNLGAGLSVVVDVNSYSNGDLSGQRFSYNTLGAFSSVGLGVAYGGPYGALAGATFTAGQMAYDGLIWYGDQVSQATAQFNNAWRNGWVPGAR